MSLSTICLWPEPILLCSVFPFFWMSGLDLNVHSWQNATPMLSLWQFSQQSVTIDVYKVRNCRRSLNLENHNISRLFQFFLTFRSADVFYSFWPLLFSLQWRLRSMQPQFVIFEFQSKGSTWTDICLVFFIRTMSPVLFVCQFQDFVHLCLTNCFHSPLFWIQQSAILLSNQYLTWLNLSYDSRASFTVSIRGAKILVDMSSRRGMVNFFSGTTRDFEVNSFA